MKPGEGLHNPLDNGGLASPRSPGQQHHLVIQRRLDGSFLDRVVLDPRLHTDLADGLVNRLLVEAVFGGVHQPVQVVGNLPFRLVEGCGVDPLVFVVDGVLLLQGYDLVRDGRNGDLPLPAIIQ